MEEIFTIELNGTTIGVYDNIEIARETLIEQGDEYRDRAYDESYNEAYCEFMESDHFHGGTYDAFLAIIIWNINTTKHEVVYAKTFEFVFNEELEFVTYRVK